MEKLYLLPFDPAPRTEPAGACLPDAFNQIPEHDVTHHSILFDLRRCASLILLQTLLIVNFLFSFGPGDRHPLDPLTQNEITAAAAAFRSFKEFPPDGLFSTIVLHEPSKQEVLSLASQSQRTREAFAIIMDRKANKVFEGVVDLSAGRVVSWKGVDGVQPAVLPDEYALVERIVKTDARWQAAMRKRGITDFEKIQIDSWAVGQAPDRYEGRLLRALSYFRDSVNFYGRPIEGVVALVNMNGGEVVDLLDTGPVPLPPPSQELDTASVGHLREAPKPLSITQPQGNSFVVDGNHIRWQNWDFRYSMHPREGLVLHTVGYEDAGRLRSVLYRGSISEMVVPYGDPDSNWRWRAAFDEGEYGLGKLASPIEPKRDAPDNALLLDAVFADESGNPYSMERAVGVYERDGGILWKHYDEYTLRNETRRARELVIFFITTIGNYDYVISWVFHQDGSLDADVALTGIMLPKGVADTADGRRPDHDRFGHLVSANIVAPHHQHFFCYRLDLDVDGRDNSAKEMNTRLLPREDSDGAPDRMRMEETVFATELQARRSVSMELARSWSIFNPAVRNAIGQPSGYVLLPGANAAPLVSPDSPVRRRAGFLNNHFWVTRYNPGEIYAAGAYPNQSKGGDGLSRWAADDQPIADKDLVAWYVFGVTHIPRPEEWPVMPVTHAGFRLVPAGFFSRNPSLDVPK
jgi:primary-amine oxidase